MLWRRNFHETRRDFSQAFSRARHAYARFRECKARGRQRHRVTCYANFAAAAAAAEIVQIFDSRLREC